MDLPPVRLDALLMDACSRFAHRNALVENGRAVTYAELATAAEQVRTELVAVGHQAGEPLIVAVDNRCGDVVAQFAAWLAHAVVVPVHRSSPVAVINAVARRTGARWVLGDPSHRPEEWAGVVSSLGGADAWAQPLVDGESCRPAELDGDQALVIFTSGSTGQPKGVVLSHRAFAGKLSAINSVLPFATGSHTTHILQLNFSFGQWTALLTLVSGGTLRLVRQFDTELLLDRLASGPTDRVAVVPSMLRMLVRALEEPQRGPERLRALSRQDSPRLWIAGGEPLTAGLGRRLRTLLPHACITDVYGLSETSTSDFILPPNLYDGGAGTIGRPSPGVSFQIARADGSECPRGDVGELLIRTPYLMTGYLSDSAKTQATMTGAWLRTGDLARVRMNDGMVELAGRSKQLIVRGGVKVSPLEIEALFAEHPGCADCLAVGLPDPVLGERIHLLVVPRNDKVPDSDALRVWGRSGMERYKVPDRFHIVPELPLGRTGKIDRLQARRIAAEAAGIGI